MFDILKGAVRGGFVRGSGVGGRHADDVRPARAPRRDDAHAARLAELRFALLADVTAADFYPREPRFEVIYLLASLGVAGFGDTPKRLRVKVRVPGDHRARPDA